MKRSIHFSSLVALCLTLPGCLSCSVQAADAQCVAVASWAVPVAGGANALAVNDVMPRAAKQSVVLLGESHDVADDHRWQLQTIAALHALRPQMAIAFEAFPRRVQPVLDRWVAGEFTEAQFLKAVDWYRVWNFDPQLYLPLFNFARINRVPMIAMNVDIALVRSIGAKGLAGVPADAREGVSPPAAASQAYLDSLFETYSDHQPPAIAEHKGKVAPPDRNDPAFKRFVESQQFWDRAMAQAMEEAAKRPGAPLVIGIVGRGHVEYGHGIAYQLADLGVKNVMSLLPWRDAYGCKTLTASYADAVFGLAPETKDAAPARPRLGVAFETADKELRVTSVEKGSIAETAGVKTGDVIVEAAGVPLKEFMELRAVIQRQAPGTWLPLKLKRGSETLELIAKFPPAQS